MVSCYMLDKISRAWAYRKKQLKYNETRMPSTKAEFFFHGSREN